MRKCIKCQHDIDPDSFGWICLDCVIDDLHAKEITKGIRYTIDTIMDLTGDDVPRMLLLTWVSPQAQDRLPAQFLDRFSPRTLELNMN